MLGVEFDEDGKTQRLYSLNPISKYYVPNKDGVSMTLNLLLTQDKVFSIAGLFSFLHLFFTILFNLNFSIYILFSKGLFYMKNC